MEAKTRQALKAKIADFRRFGFILLALSVILYLGLVIPFDGKEIGGSIVLGASSFVVLIFSIIMFLVERKLKNKLKKYQ
ncbi:YrhC family protein [Fictibacillus sp. Mic-4]|uniref:YrhC family protein n=1 Tax=Fictibacillus TaxID=1329200 RepID=UPI0003F74529|nr:YrhC family protein [Fictibacillus gelatini]